MLVYFHGWIRKYNGRLCSARGSYDCIDIHDVKVPLLWLRLCAGCRPSTHSSLKPQSTTFGAHTTWNAYKDVAKPYNLSIPAAKCDRIPLAVARAGKCTFPISELFQFFSYSISYSYYLFIFQGFAITYSFLFLERKFIAVSFYSRKWIGNSTSLGNMNR